MKKTLNALHHNSMSTLRIAPVCNGKIYVVPHQSNQMGNYYLDIPIQEQIHGNPTNSGKAVQKIKERFHLHFHTNEQPRFCVQYKMRAEQQEVVFLYILPLKEEEEIRFSNGQFMTSEEIQANEQSFSPYLQKESELLGMAAELWNDFYTGTNPEE